MEIIKRIINKISSANLKIEGRHTKWVSGVFPRFVIKDEEEAIFFITPTEDSSAVSREDTGLWTDCKAFVSALKAFFDGLWSEATDVEKRIEEIETGKPLEETVIVRDAEAAYKKFHATVSTAEERIIGAISSKDLVRFYENYPVQRLAEKGVKIRLMAPYENNLETELLNHCQIRYTRIDCLRMMVVDKRHLFQLKMPSADQETTEPTECFENMFYTNDLEYVKKMGELLESLWETSFDSSEISSEAAMRSPVKVSTFDPASKVIESMLKNNVGSVIVVENHTPVGIITEKDILARVVTVRRKPDRTLAKEIMSTPLETIESSEPLTKALRIMRNKGIRRLAVTKKGELVGILTERLVHLL